MGTRIFGKYRPLDSEGIAQLLREKPDWKVVTDTKSDLQSCLEILCRSLARRDVSCVDRVIPQIYRPETDLAAVRKLGFRQVIFTIYLGRLEDRRSCASARSDPRIVAVTMPAPRAKEVVSSLSEAGIRCYVHTVNGSRIQAQFDRGVWGVYTDSGCGGSPGAPRPGAGQLGGRALDGRQAKIR